MVKTAVSLALVLSLSLFYSSMEVPQELQDTEGSLDSNRTPSLDTLLQLLET